MAYIIAVNVSAQILFFVLEILIVQASVLTQSGATCICTDTTDPTCSNNVQYSNCLVGKNCFVAHLRFYLGD
jgi:AGZA family xanthine/uracil permease-like MFS transporter